MLSSLDDVFSPMTHEFIDGIKKKHHRSEYPENMQEVGDKLNLWNKDGYLVSFNEIFNGSHEPKDPNEKNN